MQKTKKYIVNNWKWLVITIVVSIAFTYWVLPKIFTYKLVIEIFQLKYSPSYYIFTLISLLILMLVYKPSVPLFCRYKNNIKLEEIPFTYLDGIILFVISSIATCYILFEQIFKGISFSIEIKRWSWIYGLSIVAWTITVIYKSTNYKREAIGNIMGENSDSYFPDEPIDNQKEDLLDRDKFVSDLTKQITNFPFSESFVFGLHGIWGEGKTSVLNLLKQRLSENENVIIYEFDPWYSPTPASLIKEFYEGLYASLNNIYYLPNARRIFSKYQKILSSGLKLSGAKYDIDLGEESITELKNRIEQLIASTKKRLIVFIDDIDRLQDKDDIKQVFKIVKLSGKFKNTIFVLSFDTTIISSYLHDDIVSDSSFLDKIIQNPVHLPAIEQRMIDKFVYYSLPKEGHISAIDRLFRKLEINPSRIAAFDKEFNNIYESNVKKIFSTLRDAKRYLNALYSSLPAVKNEVDLRDFLILEIIRVFYPTIYKDIWEHPSYYIPTSWEIGMYDLSIIDREQDKDKKFKIIKEHIDTISAGQKKRETLIELLKIIFFVQVENAYSHMRRDFSNPVTFRANKRITHPEVFPKYFTLKVPSTELSDEVIESIVSTWNNAEPDKREALILEDLINYKQKKQLLQLINKVLVFLSNFTEQCAKSTISAIYMNFELFVKGGRESFMMSEDYRAEALLLHLLNERIEKTNMQSVLINLIQQTPSIEFAVSIASSCRKDMGGSFYNIYDSVNLEEVLKVLDDRLTNHFIVSGLDIFALNRDIGNYVLQQWVNINLEIRQKVNDYIFKLIKKHGNYVGKLVSYYVMFWGGLSPQIKYDDLIKAFDEKRLYEAAIQHSTNPNNIDSTPEEKGAIRIFLKIYDDKMKNVLAQSRQAANKQKFLNALNTGEVLFKDKKYQEAIQEYNKALEIKEWQDDYHWKVNTTRKIWQSLLELAWNNGNLQKSYYEEVKNIASDESQIKSKIDITYQGETTGDRAPIELYYCLFYYLQWNFSDEDQKESIKSIFMTHFELATGSHTSGKSDDISQRCYELKGRIEKQ